nr:IclR family transcriptional regulator [Nocardioides panzhihuensis]
MAVVEGEDYSTRIDKSGVQAVERAIRLLEVLAAADTPQTMQSLADALHCSPSTAHRIVVTLARSDLLEFNPVTKRYSLGVGIARLAQSRATQLDLPSIVQPHLDELKAETGETVTVWTRSEEAMVCVAVREGSHEIRQSVRVGSLATLELTAGGRVLMADEDPHALLMWARRVLGGPEPELEADILKDVAEVRRSGIVMLDGRHGGMRQSDVATISAPIFGEDGRVAAALVVAGPSARFTRESMESSCESMRRHAREITTALGGNSAPVLT